MINEKRNWNYQLHHWYFIAVIGVVMKVKGTMAVSIIGGADGPTSVFVAGKLNGDLSNALIIAGAIVLGIVLLVCWKKKS